MWKEKISFDLIKVDNVVKFSNNTGFVCWLSFKPIPPKRKLQNFLRVAPRQFVFLEENIDLTTIAITFEGKE